VLARAGAGTQPAPERVRHHDERGSCPSPGHARPDPARGVGASRRSGTGAAHPAHRPAARDSRGQPAHRGPASRGAGF